MDPSDKLRITVSGTVGSGKSTIMNLLEEFLLEQGFDATIDLETDSIKHDFGTYFNFKRQMAINENKRKNRIRETKKIILDEKQLHRKGI